MGLRIGILSESIEKSEKFLEEILVQELENDNVKTKHTYMVELKDGGVFIALPPQEKFPVIGFNLDQLFLENGLVMDEGFKKILKGMMTRSCLSDEFKIQYFGG